MGYILSEVFLYASGVVLLLVLLRAARKFLQSPTAHVPGPWYSKWTSLVLDFHSVNGSRTYYVHALHQQYGPVVRIAPDEVDVTDMEAVKTIYSVKETFRKSQFYRRVTPPDQQSLFSTVDIDFHRRHRRLLAGPMAESSLKSVVPQVEARVRVAIDKMGEEMKSRGSADVFKWWLFMATDTIGELTFGDSFHMLELGRKNDYARELERVGLMSAIRTTFPGLMRLAEIIPLPVFKPAIDANDNMRRYASDSLERYRRLVDETLRLYSAAPASLPRMVPPGGTELAGYRFAEGTVVGAQAFSMHRDPVVFPDPDEFVPLRWASPTKAMKDAYMLFGRGPRIYIGLHLAKMELRLAAARFFLAFPDARVSSHEGMCDSDMRPTVHFLLAPSGGRCLIQAA